MMTGLKNDDWMDDGRGKEQGRRSNCGRRGGEKSDREEGENERQRLMEAEKKGREVRMKKKRRRKKERQMLETAMRQTTTC